MTSNVRFAEKQQFRQVWIWLMLLSFSGYMLYAVLDQFNQQPAEVEMANNTGLFAGVIGMVLVVSLFIFARLDTIIKDDAIYYRFFPFQLKLHKITWKEISKAYVRKYNPLLEYGGWGIRLGIFGKGRAFNVSGNMGLQLELTNGKKFLIGTQKPEEVELVISNYKLPE